MKKLYLLFILPFIISSCVENNTKDHTKLPNIYIQYQTGCEVRENFAISIYSKEGIMLAEKVEPTYYYGNKSDSSCIVNMTNAHIELINNFIAKAKELNGECEGEVISSAIDDYNICIKDDTTYHIIGNCDWGGLDYLSIEKALFEEHCHNLKIKNEMLKDSIDSKQIDVDYESNKVNQED